MFKNKDEELLFKLFLKEKKLKCTIHDSEHFKICKVYTNSFFDNNGKCAHIDFKAKKYYVYGLPATNLEIFNYLKEHGHTLNFCIEDDNTRRGLDAYV